MKINTSFIAMSVLAMAAFPVAATAQEAGERYAPRGEMADNVLTQAEINDLIEQARASGVNVAGSTDVRYVGGSETAVETVQCCENVEERIEERSETKETESYFEAITAREITQPIERTLIQPIERRIAVGTTETVTEDMRIEETVLPLRVEREPVPAVVVNNIAQETTETRDEVTETSYDVIGRRDITQPVERTIVVPVQRRITRPVVETVTAETRYETRTSPLQVQAQAVPAITETVTNALTQNTVEEITEVTVNYVATRDVIQPVTRISIQPVERQILRGTTEQVTAETQYVEEVLPLRVETQEAPAIVETVTDSITERTVFEVEDVYIDQITRNIIQPVVITTIQPIERQILRGTVEQVTAAVQFEEQRLSGTVVDAVIPETQVNYIPQVTEEARDQYSETFFSAVTTRDVIQPIIRTLVQPIEIRRPNVTTETITNPTRYETVRASLVVLNVGGACNCN